MENQLHVWPIKNKKFRKERRDYLLDDSSKNSNFPETKSVNSVIKCLVEKLFFMTLQSFNPNVEKHKRVPLPFQRENNAY